MTWHDLKTSEIFRRLQIRYPVYSLRLTEKRWIEKYFVFFLQGPVKVFFNLQPDSSHRFWRSKNHRISLLSLIRGFLAVHSFTFSWYYKMKFTVIFTILSALLFAAVSAAPNLTNAKRLARGWSPNPPTRRMTPVAGEYISPFFSFCVWPKLHP